MTILLGNKPIGVSFTIDNGGEKINNQDKVITENGVYTADEGYTGLGTVEVNVKGGETIEVLNKTGAVINQGAKVWLSENTQVAGSSYNIVSANYSTSAGPVLGSSGTVAMAGGKVYSVDAEKATRIHDFGTTYIAEKVYYVDNYTVMSSYASTKCYVMSDTSQYTVSGYLIVNGPYVLTGDNSQINKINLTDGSIIKSYSPDSNTTLMNQGRTVFVGNTLYSLASAGPTTKMYTFDDENNSIITEDCVYDTIDSKGYYPYGVTKDQKYIICMDDYENFDSSNNLRIIECVEKGHLKVLNAAEMPIELQKYFSGNTCKMVFNSESGVLSLIKSVEDYLVMKYENGEWTKLPIELQFPETVVTSRGLSPATFSNDMNRYAIGYGVASTLYKGEIVNLTTLDGYSAIAYSPYTVNENTITGYAMTDAEPNETVTVSVPSEVASK